MTTQKVKPNTADRAPRSGFLLYNRRPALSENILESLGEAEMITGINQGEIRMRLVGQGIGAFNIHRSLNELEKCAAGLQSIGIKTGVVEKALLKADNFLLPPVILI